MNLHFPQPVATKSFKAPYTDLCLTLAVGLVSLGIEKSLEFLRTRKLDLAKPAYGFSLNSHSHILAQGADSRRMNKRDGETYHHLEAAC
jgi:hypothetical protein